MQPGLPGEPGIGGHPLEARVAAVDGAARIGLGTEILEALRHHLGQGRRRPLALRPRPPFGEPVAQSDPQREGKSSHSRHEGEDSERPGDEGRSVGKLLGEQRALADSPPCPSIMATDGQPRLHST